MVSKGVINVTFDPGGDPRDSGGGGNIVPEGFSGYGLKNSPMPGFNSMRVPLSLPPCSVTHASCKVKRFQGFNRAAIIDTNVMQLASSDLGPNNEWISLTFDGTTPPMVTSIAYIVQTSQAQGLIWLDECLVEFIPTNTVAQFTHSQIINTYSIQFTNQSYDDPGTYLWDFGDGTQSTAKNPTHTFRAAGIYIVYLTFTQRGGLKDTTYQAVHVQYATGSGEAVKHGGIIVCGSGSLGYASNNSDGKQNMDEREIKTDLSVNTPVGELAFTRTYQQSLLNRIDPTLAQGWTHNHLMSLEENTSTTPKTLTVFTGEGGTLFFSEVEISPGVFQYQASEGSNSVVDVDTSGTPDLYILTAVDGSKFVFEQYTINKGRLLYRRWPNWPHAPQWTYSYYTVGEEPDLAGSLKQVSDEYGRALKFGYYRNSESDIFKRLKLRRVGDQSANNLNDTTPTGNYASLAYQSVDPSNPSETKALLIAVTDLRGKQWQYDYADASNPNTQNFLTHTHAPQVDATYSGSETVAITLKDIEYTNDTELVINGNMETTQSWASVSGATLTYVTSPVHSGTKSLRVNAGAASRGVEGNTWNLYANTTYIISAWVYIETVNRQVKMQVSGTSSFDQTVTVTGSWQQVTVTYKVTATTRNHKLQFIALDNPATFYIDDISIKSASLVKRRGIVDTNPPLLQTTYNFQPQGKAETVEMVAGQATKYFYAGGVPSGVENNAGHFTGRALENTFRPNSQQDGDGNGTQLYWNSDGKLLDKVMDSLRNETTFNYNPNGTLEDSIDAEGRRTRYIYDTDPEKERRVKEVVVELPTFVAINGDMETDDGWTTISNNAPDVNERTTYKVFEGYYSRAVLAEIADKGIESIPWTLQTGRTYIVTAKVYPHYGSVKMTVSDTSITTFDRLTTGFRQWETLRAVYTHSGASTSVRLQFRSNVSHSEFYIDAVTIQEYGSSLTILQHQKFEYNDWNQVSCEQLVDPANGTTVLRETERTYYETSGNGYGLLKRVTQKDMQLSGNETWTEYTYDSSGRVTKTRNGSSFGDCCETITAYDIAGTVISTTSVRDLNFPNDPVKSPKTEYEYDSIGRRIAVTTNVGTSFAQTSLTLYDALGRVTRTVTNYKNPVSGTPAYTPPGTWAWDAANKVWKDSSGTPISHGTNNDENIISFTQYNDLGAVRLQQDVKGNITLYGYDDAGRLTKTVQNALTPGFNNNYSGVDPNPSLILYPANSAVQDGDIVTEQFYDPAGNSVKTVDPLGQVAFTVYDPLNRPVKVVRSASQPTYDILADRALSNYIFSDAVDQDIVTETFYDSVGRVDHTTDVDGRVNLTLYDGLGRQYRTIRNYIPQATSPSQWVWRAVSSVFAWRLSSSNDTLVSFGASNDQNVISDTMYDTVGRAASTRDVLGRVSFSVFDGFGRVVKSIINYVALATTPDQWVWRDVSGNGQFAWRLSASNDTLVSFGTNNDQNGIAQTHYDDDGRVDWTRDSLGRQTFTVYDTLGRQVKSVTNYIPQATTPDQWVWRDVSGNGQFAWRLSALNDTLVHQDPAKSDENIISETIYDDQNRVQLTRDVRGNATFYIYDVSGRQRKTIINYMPLATSPDQWVWRQVGSVWAWRLSDANDTVVSHGQGDENDQNIISATELYDVVGRVILTRDNAGVATYSVYDALGRRIRIVENYIAQATLPDEWTWRAVGGVWAWRLSSTNDTLVAVSSEQNRISETHYNKGGQVISTKDVRGTETTFTYDHTGRRLTVTSAANTGLAATSYTCYAKSGRVLRTIQNWISDGTSPDEKGETGFWIFDPTANGLNNDQNLITEYLYDALGRQIKVIDAVNNERETAYFIDGQVKSITEKAVAVRTGVEDVVTQYRYDQLRRRRLVVQAYRNTPTDNYTDPETWFWDGSGTPNAWKDGSTPAKTITHKDSGEYADNETYNIIVHVSYDIAGRTMSRRDPRGNETTYQYDLLDRRKALTNPLNETWATVYKNLTEGRSQTELTDPNTCVTTRGFDRLGRPKSIEYGDPSTTPDIEFVYDVAGNRQKMSEFGAGPTKVRETIFNYDATRRMTSAGFDNDGDNTIDQTVSYEYDAGGLRTKLTIPGNLSITYAYNTKGQLISLTDWDSQRSEFAYDAVGRHTLTERPQSFNSRYTYDTVGRLRLLRHTADKRTLGHYAYEVDRRGNRTKALELLTYSGDSVDHVYLFSDASIIYKGGWSYTSPYYFETTNPNAALEIMVFGSEMTLNIGVGPDHGIFDIYIGGSLWESFDGYSPTMGDRQIQIALKDEGPYLFEMRNRRERNASAPTPTPSDIYRLRFERLTIHDRSFTLRTWDYDYDPVSRLIRARRYDGTNLNATPLTDYLYVYDAAGNRLKEALGEIVSEFQYNAANQIDTMDGLEFEYDANGNLKSDLTNSYDWDRANRLLSMGGLSYTYDGLGNRVSKMDTNQTTYLVDLQPSLPQVILEAVTPPSDPVYSNRYLHSPRGIHAATDGTGWTYFLQDGLGSVRSEVSNGSDLISGSYTPYGVPEPSPIFDFPFYFTGEMRDETGVQYHRARHYAPSLGAWTTLDPFEGIVDRPMSLNGYNWVEGNTPNLIDPNGEFAYFYPDCSSSLPCFLLPKWANVPCDLEATPRYTSSCASNNSEHELIDSTVIISWGYYDDRRSSRITTGCCTRSNTACCYQSNFSLSLGTLTKDGKVRTHNHYDPLAKGPVSEDTIRQFFNTYDWVEIWGGRNKVHLSPHTIELHADAANGVFGTLLLSHPQLRSVGGGIEELTGLSHFVYTSAMGFTPIRIPMGFTPLEMAWRRVARECGNQKARIAYVYSPLNSRDPQANKPDRSDLKVGYIGTDESPFRGELGFTLQGDIIPTSDGIFTNVGWLETMILQQAIGNPQLVLYSTTSSPGLGQGDSGGGYFLGNKLIGAHALNMTGYLYGFALSK